MQGTGPCAVFFVCIIFPEFYQQVFESRIHPSVYREGIRGTERGRPHSVRMQLGHRIQSWKTGAGLWGSETCISATRCHSGGLLGKLRNRLGGSADTRAHLCCAESFLERGLASAEVNLVFSAASVSVLLISFERQGYRKGKLESWNCSVCWFTPWIAQQPGLCWVWSQKPGSASRPPT